MIYKFKSKAAGDVIMLGPTGDQLLRLMGREPAAKGIIEVDAMPAAIEALERAVADDDAAFAKALAEARELTSERVVRAYRVYLAGSAMGFEQGWMSLFQMLAAKPSGRVTDGPMRGAQSQYPFNRGFLYD